MASEELKACPGCGSVNTLEVVLFGRRCRVTCDCGWRGPACLTEKEVIAAWNKRVPDEALVGALKAISSGPWSQNCDYCGKTTRYSGNPRIANHKDDCPVAIAGAALRAAEVEP